MYLINYRYRDCDSDTRRISGCGSIAGAVPLQQNTIYLYLLFERNISSYCIIIILCRLRLGERKNIEARIAELFISYFDRTYYYIGRRELKINN